MSSALRRIRIRAGAARLGLLALGAAGAGLGGPLQDVWARSATAQPPGEGSAPAKPAEARVTPPLPEGWTAELECTSAGCHPRKVADPYVHGAIREAGCEACHEETAPHRLEAADRTGEVCLVCHEGEDGWRWDHANGGAVCVDCHDPHGSRSRKLLVMPPKKLCQGCHGMGEDSPPERVHDPVRRGDCRACHHPHRERARPLLERTFRETCARCHRGIVAPGGRDPDPHAALEDGEGCGNCHEIHEAEYSQLLLEPYPEERYTADPLADFDLCFTCHDEEALLRSGESGFVDQNARNLHGVHVLIEGKGRSCRNCHRMHDTRLPHMLGPRGRMGRWRPKLEFTTEGARNTCAPACHEPRCYPVRR